MVHFIQVIKYNINSILANSKVHGTYCKVIESVKMECCYASPHMLSVEKEFIPIKIKIDTGVELSGYKSVIASS